MKDIKLNEEFYLKRGRIPFGNNNKVTNRECIYIDPQNSESSYPVHTDLKNTGAIFSKQLSTWAWPLEDKDGNPLDINSVMDNQVRPGLNILKNSTRHPNTDNPLDVDRTIENLKAQGVHSIDLNAEGFASLDGDENCPEAQEIISRLEDFKQELINAPTMEVFQEVLEPILDFGRNVRFNDINKDGYQYSLGNIISAYIQDPEATDIKTESDWADANRRVLPNAIPIWYTTPAGQRVYPTRAEKSRATAEFCRQCGVDNSSELNYSQRVALKKELDRRVEDKKYKMTLHYDVRFTELIEGEMDVYNDYLQNRAMENGYRFSESGEATAETKFYLGVVCTLCKELDIQVPDKYKKMLSNPENSNEANIGAVRDIVRIISRYQLKKDYYSINNGRYFQNVIKQMNGKDFNTIFTKQAEVCTWLVMKYLNYDVQSSIQQMNFWKMSKDDMKTAFNTVSHAATEIYKKIKSIAQEKKFGKTDIPQRQRGSRAIGRVSGALSESRIISLLDVQPWTGLQLAESFGAGKLYKQEQLIDEYVIRKKFFDVFDRL